MTLFYKSGATRLQQALASGLTLVASWVFEAKRSGPLFKYIIVNDELSILRVASSIHTSLGTPT